MTRSEIGSEIAQLLLQTGAIFISKKQPFILAAGWASPVYIDVRLLVGESETRKAVTRLATEFIKSELGSQNFDAIIGAETAGIPFSAWLADSLNIKMRYVRKHSLGFGQNAQVEGGSVEGMRVLMMDDLTTDGNSKLAFARGIRAAGAELEDILTIFYHDVFKSAGPRLQDVGLKLHAMVTWDDVLRADNGKFISPEDRTEIEKFLSDPVDWSTRHGGRSR
ncbi:orotate phosphoribosyltransferase [Microvirga sp. W0021]|uniref:Orotate phosphoribosyltransferase n=1 Tax=Hohaiivirga grylli TaxID=3133970 RepID=A0ABV0BII0_9HYPH